MPLNRIPLSLVGVKMKS